jgi:hypothetical protein
VVGRRARHPLRSLGQQALKGLTVPIEVYEVGWSPEPSGDNVDGPRLPARLAAQPIVGFVGRAAPRELLRTAWKAALEGERRVVLVAGEPGIGKTRLAREAAVEAAEGSATVLFGSAASLLWYGEPVGCSKKPAHERPRVGGPSLDRRPSHLRRLTGSRAAPPVNRWTLRVRDRRPRQHGGLSAPRAVVLPLLTSA